MVWAHAVMRVLAVVRVRAVLQAGTTALALVSAAVIAQVPGAPTDGPPREPVLASPIGPGDRPADPWTVALLPRQKQPPTRFDVIDLHGQRVLRVRAQRSYGNLLHEVPAAKADARVLRWSARVDTAPDGDLRTKEGDDVALKICALFDWPRDRLPLGERAKLAAAGVVAGQPLPTAVICWVTDTRLSAGTWLPNAYTSRIRMLVVQQLAAGASPGAWADHQRDLHADFRRAFADEWRDGDVVPPLRAVLIGADSDNTGADTLAYLRSIDLR